MNRFSRFAIPLVVGVLLATTAVSVSASQASNYTQAQLVAAQQVSSDAKAALATKYIAFTNAFDAYETAKSTPGSDVPAAVAALHQAQADVVAAIKVAHDARWAIRDLLQGVTH